MQKRLQDVGGIIQFWKKILSQQQTRPIAYIQWHIDNKEINLASKSTDLDKRKIPIAFYLKSDRFGDVWASEWFEGILRPPELWNHEKSIENTQKYWQFLIKSLYFLRFFDVSVKNVNISLDVCKKCSVTWMELFIFGIKTCRFFILLNCDFQNYWYFVWHMQKMLRHTDGVIQ